MIFFFQIQGNFKVEYFVLRILGLWNVFYGGGQEVFDRYRYVLFCKCKQGVCFEVLLFFRKIQGLFFYVFFIFDFESS